MLRQESYTYDLNGNLSTFTPLPTAIIRWPTISYDGLNRPTQIGFGASGGTYASTIGYQYDAGSRMTKATDSISGIVQRAYDGLNRLTSETTPQGSIAYTYDNSGRRSTMQAAGQPQVNYTYDIANRLTQIAQGSSSVGFSYDPTNRRASFTLPNGIVAAYGYDTGSHITGITYTLNSNQIGNLTYAYDPLGRRVAMGGSLSGTGFPSVVNAATYDVANELTNWAGSTMAYDADGNMINDGSNTYTWDARNQLNSTNSGATSFVYDPFGRRVTKTIASTSTSFLYDGANTVQELSGTTATANLITGGIDEYFSRTDSSGARNFLTDAVGSTLALGDSTGAVQTQYSYDPFGNTNPSGAATTNSFAYTGRENDGDGIYFYRARYYNPAFGRFINEDPLGFTGGGSNLYAYGYDNPVNYRDPYGLSGCDQTCQNEINVLLNLFPGSTYNEATGTMTIPQSTDAVDRTLTSQGYRDPGQWWNPFLYWDPIAHAGGDEYRTPLGPGSFHFRRPYPSCPIGPVLNPASCFFLQPQMVGRKTKLDQFHTDDHDPARDPWGHIRYDVF